MTEAMCANAFTLIALLPPKTLNISCPEIPIASARLCHINPCFIHLLLNIGSDLYKI